MRHAGYTENVYQQQWNAYLA